MKRNRIILNDDKNELKYFAKENDNSLMNKSHSILFEEKNNISTFYTNKNSLK